MRKAKLLLITTLVCGAIGFSENTTAFAKEITNNVKVQAKAVQSFKGVVLIDKEGNLYAYEAIDYLKLKAAKDPLTKSLTLKYVMSNTDKYYEPVTFLTYKALNNGDMGKTFENLEIDKKNFDINPIIVTNNNGEALIEDESLDFIIDDIS